MFEKFKGRFDLQKSDDAFVAATRDKRSLGTHVTRLCFGRSWAFVGAVLLLAFWMLMVALESFVFTASNSVWLLFSIINLVSFAHLDSQIKFLKALEGAKSLSALASLEQNASGSDA